MSEPAQVPPPLFLSPHISPTNQTKTQQKKPKDIGFLSTAAVDNVLSALGTSNALLTELGHWKQEAVKRVWLLLLRQGEHEELELPRHGHLSDALALPYTQTTTCPGTS
ncbi:hypothetical protein V8C35DRAFT_277325 [Trichoderma chlorosporum]